MCNHEKLQILTQSGSAAEVMCSFCNQKSTVRRKWFFGIKLKREITEQGIGGPVSCEHLNASRGSDKRYTCDECGIRFCVIQACNHFSVRYES